MRPRALMLTAESRATTWALAEDLGVHVAESADPTGPDGPITHANWIILVDPEGRVRGYYDPMPRGEGQSESARAMMSEDDLLETDLEELTADLALYIRRGFKD